MSRKLGSIVGGKPYDLAGRLIESCIENVADGGRLVTSHTCDRKLKGDPEYPHLCGLHISVIRRAKDREQKRRSTAIQSNEAMESAAVELEKLNTALGITSILQTKTPYTGVGAFISAPTGYAIVPIEKLRELAERLAELEANAAGADW